MKIREIILKHKQVIIEFQEWYKGDMPFHVFIDADFKYQFAYFIEFLASKNITTAISKKAYIIYLQDSLKVITSLEYEQPQLFIEVVMITTIDKAFEYLTNPF